MHGWDGVKDESPEESLKDESPEVQCLDLAYLREVRAVSLY